jgi:hypothetical protein
MDVRSPRRARPFQFSISYASFRGVAEAAFDCARRTRPFSGRAFREQEGQPATPIPFPILL